MLSTTINKSSNTSQLVWKRCFTLLFNVFLNSMLLVAQTDGVGDLDFPPPDQAPIIKVTKVTAQL